MLERIVVVARFGYLCAVYEAFVLHEASLPSFNASDESALWRSVRTWPCDLAKEYLLVQEIPDFVRTVAPAVALPVCEIPSPNAK